jgi:hypothetical protein
VAIGARGRKRSVENRAVGSVLRAGGPGRDERERRNDPIARNAASSQFDGMQLKSLLAPI